MKLYRKGEMYSTEQIDSTWEEFEDEFVQTDFGVQLKSKFESTEFQNSLRLYEINKQISKLKSNLNNTDYKAIKYAEGEISEEDYFETKQQRQAWRNEINRLEKQIGR